MSWSITDRVGPGGPERAKIMIVGEAPGAEEVKLGQPFIGKAGQLLRRFLMEVGIDPEECWLTNICKVRPPDNKIVSFFTKGLPNEAVLDGMEELQKEIIRVSPHVIVAVGNYPLWALTGKGHWSEGKPDKPGSRGYKGIGDWRGSILESQLVPGFKVIPTYHPSYILQEGMSNHLSFKADLARAKDQSAFPEIRRPQKKIVIDPQGSDRLEIRDKLLSDPSKILTFDIEYLKTKEGRPNLLCVGMTTHRDEAHVIVTRTPSDVQYVRSILESGIGLNAQNSMYDCGILDWHFGMDIMGKVAFDTMLCQHAAAIEMPKALDYLASIYTDQPQWKDMVDWDKIKKGKQDINTVWDYNAIDTWVEHEVMEEQIKHELCDPAIKQTFDFEMSLLHPLWLMSKRGVRVDNDRMKAIRKDCDEKIFDGTLLLLETFKKEINVMSRPDVSDILYNKLGLPVIKRTQTGPSCDDKTLAELAVHAHHPVQKVVIQTIRSVRRARSLISKFVDIQLGEDGRMRGLYNPARTDTGRLASAKFAPTDEGANQQNFPRDKRVRSVIIADEEMEFGYADLERAESLVVAYLADDPEMKAAHAAGIDAHRRLAAKLFRCTEEEVTDDQRYLGKKTRHAGNYMQGPKTFMANVNQDADKTGVSISFAEAKEYIETYKRMHHMLQPWWRQIEAELYKTRTLYNLLGRKRVFHDHISSIIPNAVAYKPQSTVGDVLNVGLLALSGLECEYGRKTGIVAGLRDRYMTLKECSFELLLQVHDAVGFQYLKSKRHIVLPLVRQAMLVPLYEPRSREHFTIPVEIQVGPSWGEVKLWKEEQALAA